MSAPVELRDTPLSRLRNVLQILELMDLPMSIVGGAARPVPYATLCEIRDQLRAASADLASEMTRRKIEQFAIRPLPLFPCGPDSLLRAALTPTE